MGSLTKVAAPAAAAAAVAVAAVLLVARGTSHPPASPSAAIEAHASFEPATGAFGDTTEARVTVFLDRSAVRPDTLRLTENLAPLTELTPVRTTRTTGGRLEVVSVAATAACLTDPCAARQGLTTLRLPAVTATVSARRGGTLQARAAWPALHVRSRVTAADLAPAELPFRGRTDPPPPTYRFRPGALAAGLGLIAALLAVAGVALAAYEVHGLLRRRRRPAAVDGELEQALMRAREAEARPTPDRRRALALLARLLRRRDRGLAQAASDLAWSKPTPEPRALSELVGEVERNVPS